MHSLLTLLNHYKEMQSVEGKDVVLYGLVVSAVFLHV